MPMNTFKSSAARVTPMFTPAFNWKFSVSAQTRPVSKVPAQSVPRSVLTLLKNST